MLPMLELHWVLMLNWVLIATPASQTTDIPRIDLAAVRQVQPAQTTPAMNAWAEAVFRGFDSPRGPKHLASSDQRHLAARFAHLAEALLAPEGLGLEESLERTPTAVEAFASRRANCLGLAHLTVALGRLADLPITFVEEAAAAALEERDGIRVAHRHAAAGWSEGEYVWVFDFAGLRRRPATDVVMLTDHQARGQLYANRGAEALLAGDPQSAVPWLEAAVELVSEDWVWRNLALALVRSGRPAAARVAREHASNLAGRLATSQ